MWIFTWNRHFRGSFANGGFEQDQFSKVSPSAIDCISKLLVLEPTKRFNAKQCLEHKWLTTTYLDTLKSLETALIRKYLARRRWHRWFNAIKAMNRMKSFSSTFSSSSSTSNKIIEQSEEPEEPITHPEICLPEYKTTPNWLEGLGMWPLRKSTSVLQRRWTQ